VNGDGAGSRKYPARAMMAKGGNKVPMRKKNRNGGHRVQKARSVSRWTVGKRERKRDKKRRALPEGPGRKHTGVTLLGNQGQPGDLKQHNKLYEGRKINIFNDPKVQNSS